MALALSVPHPRFGADVAVNYHRIEEVTLKYQPDPLIVGSKGVAIVTVRGYTDKAARDAGKGALSSRNIQVRFGAAIEPGLRIKGMTEVDQKVIQHTENGPEVVGVIPARPEVAAVKSDDPTLADIYGAVRSIPEFKNATDA